MWWQASGGIGLRADWGFELRWESWEGLGKVERIILEIRHCIKAQNPKWLLSLFMYLVFIRHGVAKELTRMYK